jgi:hypothetical protein
MNRLTPRLRSRLRPKIPGDERPAALRKRPVVQRRQRGEGRRRVAAPGQPEASLTGALMDSEPAPAGTRVREVARRPGA